MCGKRIYMKNGREREDTRQYRVFTLPINNSVENMSINL